MATPFLHTLKPRALLLGMVLPERLWGVAPEGPRTWRLAHPQSAAPSPEEVLQRGGPAPRPRGERIASWVTSRELRYASSDAQGAERRYSGRVYLPRPWRGRRPLDVPLVVFVHGTAALKEDIPQFNRGAEAMAGAMAATYHHLVVAMPDLPGYGHDPSLRPHPYCHAKSLALSVLDMIEPTLALLDPRKLRWDGRLFLLGYSSGGYGALAAVRELQSNPRYQRLCLTAAACMGGPFHFSASTRAFLTGTVPYHRPDIQAFLLCAYHDLYPEGDLFAPVRALNPELLKTKAEGPDQGALLNWLEGQCSSELICARIKTRLTGAAHLPVSAASIMNPEWLADQFLCPAWPDTDVGRILMDNDLVGGWHPGAPMLLATSPEDECVPASNTYALMQAWSQRGCTAKVEFYPLTLLGRPLDHATGGMLAVEKAFRWFASGAYATAAPALPSRP